MNMSPQCCGQPLNMFWRYCPLCGKGTDLKREMDRKTSDEWVARMEKRQS